MRKKILLRNESGQMIVEYVLMATIVAITIGLVSSFIKENELLGQVVTAPWEKLSGMIQNGQWGSPEETMSNHPNNHALSTSLRGDSFE